MAAADELESHETAPALDEIAAQQHFGDDTVSRNQWHRRVSAAVEFAAMASVLYRDDRALFNARDGAIPYYALRYLTEGQSDRYARLIAMSPNTGSMDHPESSAYLRENGVSDQVAVGQRLVLLDGSIGWGRTLSRLRLELSPALRHRLVAHSMMGFGEDHGPVSRMSLLHLWGGGEGARMPTMADAAPQWEDGITFDVNPARSYARGKSGTLVAQALPAAETQRATGRQWKAHMRHLLDQPEHRALFAQRQRLWSEAKAQLASGDSAQLLGWLEAQLDEHPGPLGEAIVRDVIAIALTHHREHFTWDYLPGFAELAETLAGRRGAASIQGPLRALLHQLPAGGLPAPPDGSVLRHPHTGAVYVIQQGKKWWVPDPSTFAVMNLHDRPTHDADPQLLGRLPDTERIDLGALNRLPRDGALLRNPENGAVYLVTAGTKWHVPDPQTFARMRLRSREMRQVHPRYLSQLPSR